jgi:hypothetical protein
VDDFTHESHTAKNRVRQRAFSQVRCALHLPLEIRG